MLLSQYCCVPPTHLHHVPLWPSLATLPCPFIFYSPISLPPLKPESIARTSLSLWSSQDDHSARNKWHFLRFCASMMALLYSYTPSLSLLLKYMYIIKPSTSPASGCQLKVLSSFSCCLKTLAQAHNLPFHSCCWHQFRQIYTHVAKCHF